MAGWWITDWDIVLDHTCTLEGHLASKTVQYAGIAPGADSLNLQKTQISAPIGWLWEGVH